MGRRIVDVIADQKGENVLLLDIREISILADFFVIASITSERQAKAVLDEVKSGVKQASGIKPLHVEGGPSAGWILMDYGSVVVHLLTPEARAYYDLEGLWEAGRIVVRML